MTAAIALGLYAVCVVAFLVGNHRWRRYQDSRTVRITPAYPWCVPVRPPVSQVEVDECWLDAWPTDMSRQQCDRLFDDLIAMEGLQ